MKKKNIITLFKACYLALKTFTNKRILSLSEIKRIIIHTTGNSVQTETKVPAYDEDSKQIVHIGI